ncbi:MAG TPA: hypothetical protein VF655_07485 [Allosphingosinicella sp.]|jgi:hypothetical protein
MHSKEQRMDGKQQDEGKTPPPGEGEGVAEASEDAVKQMENQQDGARHAGYGDGG